MDTYVIRTQGRAEIPVDFEVVGEIDSTDLILLDDERGIKPPELKSIKANHHRLAQLLASGVRPLEASVATGYSLSRISILKADPAFQALMSEYQGEVREEFRDFAAKMAMVAQMATDNIIERLEDKPEEFTTNQLLEVTKTFADRAGFGPQTKNQTVSVNVSLAGRLEQARRRAALGGELVELTAVEESIA